MSFNWLIAVLKFSAPFFWQRLSSIVRRFYHIQDFQLRAVRRGDWKYLKIAGNEFLFNLAEDARERANYSARNPEIFNQLKQQWEDWDKTMLAIPENASTHVVDGKLQSDRHGVISNRK